MFMQEAGYREIEKGTWIGTEGKTAHFLLCIENSAMFLSPDGVVWRSLECVKKRRSIALAPQRGCTRTLISTLSEIAQTSTSLIAVAKNTKIELIRAVSLVVEFKIQVKAIALGVLAGINKFAIILQKMLFMVH